MKKEVCRSMYSKVRRQTWQKDTPYAPLTLI